MGNHQSSLLLLDYSEVKVEDIKKALQERPSLATSCSQPSTGNRLLHLAAGNHEVVDELLGALYSCLRHKPAKQAKQAEHKAANRRNNLGQTPLMLACKAGCVRSVQLLLGAGADPTLMDGTSQRNCLHYAARYGRAEVIEVLLGDTTWSPATGRQRLLREALVVDSQGFHKYTDSRSSLGISPLHLAVSRGHRQAARTLIKVGASLTLRCNPYMVEAQGFPGCSTALHLAAAQGDQSMALLLLMAWPQHAQRRRATGPDPRALRDCLGRRPVDVALEGGHSALLSLLSPTTPLPQVVPQPASISVPRLASMATAALLRRLHAQLDALAAQQGPQHAEEVSAANGLSRGKVGSEAACCPICLEDGSTSALWAANTVGEAGGAEGRQRWQVVAAAECQHTLCVSCAKELCCGAAVGTDGTVKCPLCRRLVGAWVVPAGEA